MRVSVIPELVPGSPVSDDMVHAVSRLEADLERQTALREARDRIIAEGWQGHEDAHERLLGRCRALEDEKVRWAEAGLGSLDDLVRLKDEHRNAMTTQADDLSRAFEARSEEMQRHHGAIDEARERDAAALRETAAAERAERDLMMTERDRQIAERDAVIAERDRQIAERDAVIVERDSELAEAGEREGTLDGRLAGAEERFRVDAFRLTALIALRSKEAEDARIELEATQQRLALLVASTSWKLGRPLRATTRLIQRLRRAPGRLVRIVRR